MKRQSLLYLVLLGVALGCCACAGTPEPVATPSPAVTLTATASPLPTKTPTRWPTKTPVPTRLPTKTPSPTSTSTLTPTPLSPEARQALIERNLSIEGCEPPCWGGITPGETRWKDALDLWRGAMTKVAGTSDVVYAVVGIGEACSTCGPDRVELWSDGETVTGIYIGERYFGDWAVLTGTLSAYLAGFRLSDVLERYGPPSQAYAVGYVGEYYDALWLEYADLGLLFRYPGYAVYDSVAPPICLIAESTPGIAVSFQAPGSAFQAFVGYNNALEKDSFDAWRWTTVKHFSPEAFYATFRDPEASACLQVVNPTGKYFTSLVPETFESMLSIEEDAALPALLAANGDCELPCWWGITPGVTRIEDVQAFFAGYGKPMGRGVYSEDGLTRYYGGLFARHDPAPLDYTVRQSFDVEAGVVTAIYVLGKAPMPEITGDGPQSFFRDYKGERMMIEPHNLAQDWQRYALAPTMRLLGIPSRVLVDYNRLDCYDGYQLAIVYDDLGIMAHYGGKVQSKDDKVLICPFAESVTSFGFFLTTTDSEVELGKKIQACYPGCDPITLEEAADIQPDAFYRAYVNPAAANCFEVREELGIGCP